MKSVMAKRSTRRAIGLLLGDREVSLSVVASTPLGKKELARSSEPRGSGPLEDVIGPMVDPWLSHKPRPKVVLGVPEVRVFHAARTSGSASRKDPEAWLQESLKTQGTRVEEMIIDVVEAPVGKKSVAGLVSCRRKFLAEAMEALASRKARVALAEPAPCALLRAATARQRNPRGSKLVARFLMGEGRSLGMIVAGGIPLHWRVFDLPFGEEPKALLAAFYAMRMHVRSWQTDAGLDGVVIHGRPDLNAAMNDANLGDRLGVKMIRVDGPGFDPGSTAMGLALGGLTEDPGFDLARTLKPRESIREIFPWSDLAIQVGLLGAASLLMHDRVQSLGKDHDKISTSMKKYKWLGERPADELEKEKKLLEEKDRTAEAFLESRVLWSGHLGTVALKLPTNTRMTSMQGLGELELPSGKAPAGPGKKQLTLKLETLFPPTGEAPREVDGLLESIREHEPLRRDFPLIELKDLKTIRGTVKGAEQVASYSINCLPPAPKSGGPKKE